MKLPVWSSLKTKLFLWLSLFVVGISVVITLVVYRFMYETIREDRMRVVGQAASTRYRLLVNELEFKNSLAKSLLYRIAKHCTQQSSESKKLTKNQYKLRYDVGCVRTFLDVFNDSEAVSGILTETLDNSQHWLLGDIDPQFVDKLDFSHGHKLAHFQFRSDKNHPEPFYIQVLDNVSRLKITVKYPLKNIESIFFQNAELGHSGESFLADERGRFITSPRYELNLQKNADYSQEFFVQGLLKHFNGSEAIETCLQNKNAESMGTDYRGVPIINGFRFVPEIGGGCILAHIEQDEVFSPLQKLKKNIIGIDFIFSGLSLVLFYFLSFQIFKPLAYLASVARRIAAGNYSERSQLQRKDEVGVLSDSFNKMTDTIIEAEDNFILAVENIKDYAITLLDKEGRIRYWNRSIEKLYRMTESDVVGVYYSCYFTDEDRRNRVPEKKLEKAMVDGNSEIEGLRRRGDGTTFYAHSQCSAIFDDQKKHRGFILITRDITEKKELEASAHEARRANFQKTSFMASMSHEIRTPLNSLIGVIQILKEKVKNPDDARLLNVAYGAGEALLTVINDVLDISKIEAGEVRLESAPFDLREQITMCRDIMKIKARSKKIEILTEIDSDVGTYYFGDATRLRQILINLLGNSVKFSEEGDIKITVSLKARKPIENRGYLSLRGGNEDSSSLGHIDELQFSVSDRGIGIPPQMRETIFERFKQADESITRRFGGTGLGLSICKNLVELMKGRIWVESEVGAGSTFYFTIELTELGGSVSTESTDLILGGADVASLMSGDYFRNELKKVGKSKFKVLLADDAEDNILIFRSFFKQMPFDLTIVKNGEEAVRAFKANEFDIVFMDVQMPVLDGYSATREIRNWERSSKAPTHTPIIAVTANALDEDVRMSHSVGCDDHLCKPIRKEKLLRLAEVYLVNLGSFHRG